MANTLLTTDMITKEALRVLKNNLAFAGSVNRSYDSTFANDGAQVGATARVRKPPKYAAVDGATISIQDSVETKVDISLDKQKHVAMQFGSKDMTLSIEEFSKRFVVPAVAPLANKIDADGLALYKDIYNTVGVPGTAVTTLQKYLDGHALLSNTGAPMNPRQAVIGPLAQASLVNGLSGLFNNQDLLAKQYKKGVMFEAAGFEFQMDQNVATHTVGPQGGTPLMNGATASGASSIVTNGWTAAAASRLKQGDVFTIAGVFGALPQSGDSTTALQQFVVTADVSSDGAGNATIPISPSIVYVSGGASNTVTALPVNGAALVLNGTAGLVGKANMLFHPDAFALVMADLKMPDGGAKGSIVKDEDLGLSIRFVSQYDISNDRNVYRLDVLYGWKTLYPELACRLMS